MTVYALGIIRRLGGDSVDGMTEDGTGLHCHVERSRASVATLYRKYFGTRQNIFIKTSLR